MSLTEEIDGDLLHTFAYLRMSPNFAEMEQLSQSEDANLMLVFSNTLSFTQQIEIHNHTVLFFDLNSKRNSLFLTLEQLYLTIGCGNIASSYLAIRCMWSSPWTLAYGACSLVSRLLLAPFVIFRLAEHQRHTDLT